MDLDLLMESKIDIEKQRVTKKDDYLDATIETKIIMVLPGGARNKKY